MEGGMEELTANGTGREGALRSQRPEYTKRTVSSGVPATGPRRATSADADRVVTLIVVSIVHTPARMVARSVPDRMGGVRTPRTESWVPACTILTPGYWMSVSEEMFVRTLISVTDMGTVSILTMAME
jgi:hypothetical protein